MLLILSFFVFVFAQNNDSSIVSSESGASECSAEAVESYNQSLHVAGIFIILLVSFLGMFSPLFLGKKTAIPAVKVVLQIVKMFGIGVIAGTAWIHLLPDAFEQFSNPCLDAGWAVFGTNYVGLFACIAAFAVQIIEQGAISHAHGKCISAEPHHSEEISTSTTVTQEIPNQQFLRSTEGKHVHVIHSASEKGITAIVLELGILVHSLIIGITLGVSSDDGFGSLLAAVAFHQLFEGLALGVLITSTILKWRTKVLLGCLYPITTPIGISIGIGIRNTFNANSNTMILVQGIFVSLSAGILFYNTYVELIGGEINHNEEFRKFSREFKAICYVTMFSGAAIMAVIAIWA